MSRVVSPRARGLNSPSFISLTTSNFIAAKKSVSPPQPSEITMQDVAEKPIHNPVNFATNRVSSEEDDSSKADEVTPLITNPVSSYAGENGASKIKGRGKGHRNTSELPEPVRCDCHETPKPTDKGSRNRLIVACIVVLLFMIGEVIGTM